MNLRSLASKSLTSVLVVLALIVGINTVREMVIDWRRSADAIEAKLRRLVGQTVPAFQATALDGSAVPLPVSARPTILYFFSSRCGACEANQAAWDALVAVVYKRAVVVMLSFEDREAILRYQPQDTTAYLVAHAKRDMREHSQNAYHFDATPTLYVIDAAGVLRFVHLGVFTEGVVDAVLAELARSI